MLPALQKELAAHSRVARYLVGVSGGRDSVCLLHALIDLGYQDLIVCHVNHGLRGKESDRDATFVKNLAARLRLTLDRVEVDVAGYAAAEKLSLETAARAIRLQFFAACAEEHGTRQLFLAHHADDQAETVLLNVLRGTGLAGIAAMQPTVELQNGLHLLRPMLSIRRDEIGLWAKQNRIRWREDSSNADPTHTRNRIRLQAMPLLREVMDRDVAPALTRLATIAQRDDECLAEWADAALARALTEDRLSLSIAELKDQHSAIQHRVILSWLRERSVPAITAAHLQDVLALLHQRSPSRCNLPGGYQARRKAKTLRVERQEA
jgi:tRNA(Ile)-lysidine synthase